MPPTRQKSIFDPSPTALRLLVWGNLCVMTAFILGTFARFGANAGAGTGWGLTLALISTALIYLYKTRATTLTQDANTISNINTFLIRAGFFIVLLVGLGDALISFLRVEGFLSAFIGKDLEQNLGRSHFRGPYVHIPLIIIAIITATRTRTLGFHWLALLIVIAELLIVLFRFIFSYEQAFLSDLVRFWYGALFLFASAFTLLEEGHVRVDVLYASFTTRTKSVINAYGSLCLGIPLCWTILYLGMGQKTAIIMGPLLNFETSQAGFGLYVKYLMAGFLLVFAVSMMLQFSAYLMSATADYLDPDSADIRTDKADAIKLKGTA